MLACGATPQLLLHEDTHELIMTHMYKTPLIHCWVSHCRVVTRQDSISAVLQPEQLAYLDNMLMEDPLNTSDVTHGNPHNSDYPQLIPCAAEWNPQTDDERMCHALEDGAMSG